MKHLLISCVRLYRWILSPAMRFLFGTSGACRFAPTCSCYAIEAFQHHGARAGFLLAVKRLLRCHPWGSSGYDPVPPFPIPAPAPDLTFGVSSGEKLN